MTVTIVGLDSCSKLCRPQRTSDSLTFDPIFIGYTSLPIASSCISHFLERCVLRVCKSIGLIGCGVSLTKSITGTSQARAYRNTQGQYQHFLSLLLWLSRNQGPMRQGKLPWPLTLLHGSRLREGRTSSILDCGSWEANQV